MNDIEFAPGEPTEPAYSPPPPTVAPGPNAGVDLGVPLDGPLDPDEEWPPAGRTESPKQPRIRQVLGPQSLTARLVSGIVVLVVLLVTAVGATTYYALRNVLSDRLDQQLLSTAAGADRVLNSTHNGPTPQDVYGVAIDPITGEWLSFPRGEGVKALRLRTTDRARLAGSELRKPITVETTDGTYLRVVTTLGGVGPIGVPGTPATVVIGLSMTDERRTLSKIILIEILIGGASVLVAILATIYGVRFTLRRLRRVTATAQEVAAELSPEGAGLDRRVPDDEPDTEVGQLATSFNTMLAAVEMQFAARLESEQRMRQFLADASHELRTPLTSIRGYAELARMQRAVGGTVLATEDDNLARIESEGTRMSRLVEDLLMLARGDSGGGRVSEREYIDVSELLDDAVSGARASFPDRVIDVDVQNAPHVVGDRDQLLRVVRNLVTNAAVHTAAGRPIRVRGFESTDGVSVQVIDGGPGLPSEDAAHVFERFWRADKARTRARGGSGLGLSIVASIVRAHGGTVRFDSTVESGSTVTVWLPGAQPV